MTATWHHCVIIMMVLAHESSALCSAGPFESRGSPHYIVCPDHQAGSFYRTGNSDPRWPSQVYGYSSMHSQSPPFSYSQNQGGYGNGYSYGYNDIRRSGSPPSYSYSANYVSYPRPNYPPNYPYNYNYGRGDAYHQTMQYYPSSSQYYPKSQNPYPSANRWWPPVENSYHTGYQYPNTGQFRSDHLPDPNFLQQQNYLSPFGRPSFMREGYAIMKGHPSTSVDGKIEFCQVGTNSIRIKGRLTGVPGGPGNRGLHILKDGACPPLSQFPIDPKALEHFNPFNSPVHGSRDSAIPQKHAGDLGNIFVQMDGVTNMDFTVEQLTLDHPIYSIANHSIVITDHEDDMGVNQNIESRFRGNSGRAIACGVIQVRDSPLPPPMMPASPYWEDPFARRPEYFPPHPHPYPPQVYPFAN